MYPDCSILMNRYYATLTLTLTRTLWGDQCLEAVACEGSRLIRPAWILCLEILNVDWTLIGPLGVLWGFYITEVKQPGCTYLYPHKGVRKFFGQ